MNRSSKYGVSMPSKFPLVACMFAYGNLFWYYAITGFSFESDSAGNNELGHYTTQGGSQVRKTFPHIPRGAAILVPLRLVFAPQTLPLDRRH